MSAFILGIMITMGTGENLRSFEVRLNKEFQLECLKDAKTFQFPLPIIIVETRC